MKIYPYSESKKRHREERDARKKPELIDSGWRMVTIWECELGNDPVSLVEDLCMQLRRGRDG